MVIPENIGGFTEREIGIFDGAGNLIVVANCAAIEKTDPATGSPSSQVIRLPIAVSDTSASRC
ncbi:phage tail protein, partial [Hafnia alvei]|uniref:phage tail-collar fiber domain-containing protein n=1 Tax=Hafnia alvei TaxID=569 RepID=UPI0018DE0B54